MSPLPRILTAAALMLALASCGGPVRRLNPPSASIQQLSYLADGRWQLAVRIENFNSMTTHCSALKAKFDVGGVAAGEIAVTPEIEIPAQSADVVEVALAPTADARKAFLDDVKHASGAAYQLKGTITVSDSANSGSQREFPFEHKSRLSPVPGLTDVYR